MTKLTPKPVSSEDIAEVIPASDPIGELPILILFPHNRCNCRCTMCDIWRYTGREEIAPAEIAEWLPEWKRLGVRRIVLSGGEPLMHSDLWAFCEPISAAGIGITVLSTGILLRRHARELVRYCDDIVVSLDGPETTHDDIRRVRGAFRKLGEGVMAVRDYDREVTVSARCTVQRRNFRELRATVAAAQSLGLDRISFLPVDVSSDAFNHPGRPEGESEVDEAALRPDELPLLSREIDDLERECAKKFASGFIVESPEKLRRRILQYFEALLERTEFAPIQCNAPWVSSVIETDGTVRPCFFQPPLGNVRETGSLDGIINSDAARAWRRGLDMARNEICRKCVCSLALRRGPARYLSETASVTAQ